MQDDGIEPDLPSCSAPHLVHYLFEIGPTSSAGMGPGPFPHSEIESWQHNTGIELDAWECGVLRRLSRDYAAESMQATRRDRPPPTADRDQIENNRDAVANKFRAFMGSNRVS